VGYHSGHLTKTDIRRNRSRKTKGRFWPIKIKWNESIRPKDLKQIVNCGSVIFLGLSFHEHLLDQRPVLFDGVV